MPTPPTTRFPAQLLEGYRAFRVGRLPQEQDRLASMALSGQAPKVMLIGCCDSRVPPEVIFDARPGEIFVMRNVANLVPPYRPNGELHGTSAALEYAVQALKVEQIVVLGHGHCGGVRAFATADRAVLSPSDFIGQWISLLVPAARDVPDGDRADVDRFAHALEIASLKQSLVALRSYPCIAARERKGRIALHAAHFDVRTGALSLFEEERGALVPLREARAAHRPAQLIPGHPASDELHFRTARKTQP